MTDLHPLGRVVDHDERSREYPAMRASHRVTTEHHRHGRAFDQGNVGSCTGNAMAGALMTDPLYLGKRLTERTAIKLYTRATELDRFPGSYPHQDTGSSGLAVAKAAKQFGYITAYRHAFGLDAALDALVVAPWIAGIAWYDSFDEPDGGYVEISPNAGVRGGHEVEGFAVDVDEQTVAFWNSWGPSWGEAGTFHMSWDTFGRLLDEQGDVTTLR